MSPTRIENLLVWGDSAEDDMSGAVDQAAQASRLPFLAGPLALMPDAHVGLGSTIGSVIPTQGAIIPAAVGVDIGCGMIAVETDLTADGLPDDLDRFLGYVAKVVPAGLGKGHDRERVDFDWTAVPGFPATLDERTTEKDRRKVFDQFGTLGSGNHFVEVCLDERERVWVVLHSGSRGIGNQLAQRHISEAKGLMKRYWIELEDPDLAYLVENTPEFDSYITDMLWAQDYARANREAMMDAILTQLWGFVGTAEHSSDHGVGREVRRINCHHNYTEREHHHGKNVWLTRKGAIRARLGDEGVIPGSMGTSSYIVRGLGNPSSYCSSSHGAGRRLSRGRARRELSIDAFAESMGGRTWQSTEAKTLLDEAPAAYKDIDAVMARQTDLVEVEHRLTQVMNYKGA